MEKSTSNKDRSATTRSARAGQSTPSNENSSSAGGADAASGTPEPRGATGRNEQEPSAKSEQHEHIDRNERDHSQDFSADSSLSAKDLNSLEEEDELAGSRRGLSSYSETDEDEDEGVGDGNIGRSTRSRGLDEEG